MKDINITVFQQDILWKKKTENLQRYSDSLKNFNEKTDLILLPEMFQTGFCTNPEDISEGMDGETIRWMKRTAEQLAAAEALLRVSETWTVEPAAGDRGWAKGDSTDSHSPSPISHPPTPST